MRDIESFLSLIFFVSPLYALNDAEAEDLKKYVGYLIDEGCKLVHNKNLTESQRYRKYSRLIRSHLHLDWMAKYTLGHNCRTISGKKITEFAKIYSQFVVKVYADLPNNYNGEKAIIKNLKKIDDDMFIVNMKIARPPG